MHYNGCGNCAILFRKGGPFYVCVLLLDASKAFDKVSFEKYFEMLLSRNVCHRNHICHVIWANEL